MEDPGNALGAEMGGVYFIPKSSFWGYFAQKWGPRFKNSHFPTRIPDFSMFSPHFSGAAEVFQRNRWRIKECWIFPGFGVVCLGFFGVKSGFLGVGRRGSFVSFPAGFPGNLTGIPKNSEPGRGE